MTYHVASKKINIETQVNEGADYTFKHVFGEDTSGLTLTAKIRASDATSGSGTQVATASGDTAGTQLSWDLDLSSESADEYDFEIIDGNSKVWYPPPDTLHRIVIRDRFTT